MGRTELTLWRAMFRDVEPGDEAMRDGRAECVIESLMVSRLQYSIVAGRIWFFS